MKECTRRILRYVLRDCCAKLLNWKGKGGKRALSQTALCTVIMHKLVIVILLWSGQCDVC